MMQILVGPSDSNEHLNSAGTNGREDGTSKYHMHNLPSSQSGPGVYELGVTAPSWSQAPDNHLTRTVKSEDVIPIYIGQGANIRQHLQKYGQAGAHLEPGRRCWKQDIIQSQMFFAFILIFASCLFFNPCANAISHACMHAWILEAPMPLPSMLSFHFEPLTKRVVQAVVWESYVRVELNPPNEFWTFEMSSHKCFACWRSSKLYQGDNTSLGSRSPRMSQSRSREMKSPGHGPRLFSEVFALGSSIAFRWAHVRPSDIMLESYHNDATLNLPFHVQVFILSRLQRCAPVELHF